jgi:hypothetical protein
MERHSRPFIWALIIASTLALLIVGRALWGELEARGSRMPEVAGGQTAQQARSAVQSWLANWHAGAGIVSIATAYQRGDANDEAGWQVQVYAPGKQRIAILRVHGQEIWVLREIEAPYAQTILPESAWRMDSHDTINLWWQNQGQDVWSRVETEMLHMRLALNESGVPTWQITVTQQESSALTFWELAADTGEILQINQTGGVP